MLVERTYAAVFASLAVPTLMSAAQAPGPTAATPARSVTAKVPVPDSEAVGEKPIVTSQPPPGSIGPPVQALPSRESAGFPASVDGKTGDDKQDDEQQGKQDQHLPRLRFITS